MRYACIFCLWMMPLIGLCQQTSGTTLSDIPSVKYSWKLPKVPEATNLRVTPLFEGSAHDMEYLKMTACDLATSKKQTSLQVPSNEEHLLIVKSGTLTISFADSTWSLAPGSVALLTPGQKYVIQNSAPQALLFYRMEYRAKSAPNPPTGEGTIKSFVRDWNKLTFRAHDRGGIRRYFETPTAMCKRFEMHVTTLNPGIKSHEPHTHRAEEIVLVMENTDTVTNETEMQIGEAFFKGTAGDIYYLGSDIPHAIRNRGSTPCTYFAFQFE